MILCGDFFQLPPVTQNNAVKEKFCFQSPIWRSIVDRSFHLKHVHRQGDIEFVRILEAVRRGCLSDADASKLNQRVGIRLDETDGILPTHIFTHNSEVDKMNSIELEKLPGESFVYNAVDTGDEISKRMIRSICPFKDTITLKLGTQVILLKTINAASGLVNGARGVVTRFFSENRNRTNFPIVKFSNGCEQSIRADEYDLRVGGKTVASRTQLPISLSWAISVHRSQGMTVEKAVLDLQKSFASGQAYVALSRVKSLEGLSLQTAIKPSQVRASDDVLRFYSDSNLIQSK